MGCDPPSPTGWLRNTRWFISHYDFRMGYDLLNVLCGGKLFLFSEMFPFALLSHLAGRLTLIDAALHPLPHKRRNFFLLAATPDFPFKPLEPTHFLIELHYAIHLPPDFISFQQHSLTFPENGKRRREEKLFSSKSLPAALSALLFLSRHLLSPSLSIPSYQPTRLSHSPHCPSH